jgi:hypothetical protein
VGKHFSQGIDLLAGDIAILIFGKGRVNHFLMDRRKEGLRLRRNPETQAALSRAKASSFDLFGWRLPTNNQHIVKPV